MKLLAFSLKDEKRGEKVLHRTSCTQFPLAEANGK